MSIKKVLPLFLIIMVLLILPQSFADDVADDVNVTADMNSISVDLDDSANGGLLSAGDGENDVLKDDYDYVSTPTPSSVDYVKGQDSFVNVTADYVTQGEDYWAGLDLSGSEMYVYIEGVSSGIPYSGVASESKSFVVNLKDLDNYFEVGNTYSLVFHPPNGLINTYYDIDDFKFNPLTVNVVENTNPSYDYLTNVTPSSVNYTKGQSTVVTVDAIYDAGIDLSDYGNMIAWINGEESTNKFNIDNVDSGATRFTFDLAVISDRLEYGENVITFHPNVKTIRDKINSDNYYFAPLVVNVTPVVNSSYYRTTVTPSSVNYVKNESNIVNVNAEYSSNFRDSLNSGHMFVFVNDNEGIELEFNSNTTSFAFDLQTISDLLNVGTNNITFHPEEALLQNSFDNLTVSYSKLTVEVSEAETVEYIYVSTNGSDANDGSIGAPVASISKALKLVGERQIENILILPGRYYENSITINRNVNIKGEGIVIIDAEKIDRIFTIDGPYDVKLDNLVLINGTAPTDGVTSDIHEVVEYAAGGAINIVNEAYVEMTNMIFMNNFASEFGGAINSESPYTIVRNSIFLGNVAGVYGGAIDFESANCLVDNCSFAYNDAANGGAIGWIGDNARILNSNFENNTAGIGAAIFIENTEKSEGNLIFNNTFINNEATEQGGAIEVENADMHSNLEWTLVDNNIFKYNYAFNGGAVSAYYGSVGLRNNLFINNTAGYGGAIASITTRDSRFLIIGTLGLRNNTIINCSASENGNAIFNMGYIGTKLNITFMGGKTIECPDGKAIVLNVTVCDDVGNLISGTPLEFRVGGKATINPASDLIEGVGQVRFVPRENGTFIVSGIYGSQYDMDHLHNVVIGQIIVENAISDNFGVIYVSAERGDDDNNGSIGSPVKTFNQGYLLAARDGGSYNMVIYEGTYEAYGYLLEKDFTVTGIGNPTLDAKNNGTIFSLHGGANTEFRLTGLTFVNGVASPSKDASMRYGGAIFFKGGKLFLENDTFKRNSAAENGGALYVNQGLNMNTGELCSAYAEIRNCEFTNNLGKYDGGAIALYESTVVLINTTFNSNSAKYGGAVTISGGRGSISIINSSFYKNVASEIGGALDVEALNTYDVRYYANVINCSFEENSAPIGGAIVGQGCDVINCTFIRNSANSGGAIAFGDTESNVSKSIFDDNVAVTGKAYYGNSTNIDNNYWGAAYNSFRDLKSDNVIYVNSTGNVPKTWYNSIEELRNNVTDENNTSDINGTGDVNGTGNNTGDINGTGNNTGGNETPAVVKVKTTLNVASKTFAITKTKTLTATLRDVKGNPIKNKVVTFTVNGKKYSSRTNSKGVATKIVALNKIGSFKYKVSFAGNDNYKASSKSAYVKVIKEKTTLKVSKTAFKVNTKTKKVYVTLKSASKAPIKKVKVTLRVNGRTYFAKTNSKGVVALNINILKKGSYNAIVKFAGNSNYNGVSKTVKILIR